MSTQTSNIETQIAVLNTKLEEISKNVSEIKVDVKEIKEDYATKKDLNGKADKATVENIQDSLKEKVSHDEFVTVKALVYGFAGLILTSVAVAIISLVINNQK